MCVYMFGLFFLFKQKTAYEMRISDWSSDVCSYDLNDQVGRPVESAVPAYAQAPLSGGQQYRPERQPVEPMRPVAGKQAEIEEADCRQRDRHRRHEDGPEQCGPGIAVAATAQEYPAEGGEDRAEERSEEHTSELQSLMRISYAVFCLQKKNNKKTITQSR